VRNTGRSSRQLLVPISITASFVVGRTNLAELSLTTKASALHRSSCCVKPRKGKAWATAVATCVDVVVLCTYINSMMDAVPIVAKVRAAASALS